MRKETPLPDVPSVMNLRRVFREIQAFRKLAILCFFLFPSDGPGLSAAGLGEVHFENSCLADLHPQVNQAVALLHSFEFHDAEIIFSQLEVRDPTCGIAAWGIALAKTGRSGATASQATLKEGWDQLRPWLSLKPGTQREQMYLDAIRSLYEGYSDTSGSVRWNRYLERMAAIRHAYPKDDDASLFYALGLVWTAGEGPAGIARRREALNILLPIFRRLPNHPGAAHYIIHAADTPELARLALPAARKYAAIAPDSPHATHMPSHIFSRLGYWQEMVRSNEDSARLAAEWLTKGRDGRFDEYHALAYLEYGYLQLNQREKARDQISRIRELMGGPGGNVWAEIDAWILYDVATSDWQDALTLKPPDDSPLRENFDIFWVHTLAASHLARIEIARDALKGLKESIAQQDTGESSSRLLHLYLLQAEAAMQAADGKRQEAVQTLRSAIAYEAEHPVDYPTILAPPSAEILGTLLLGMGAGSEARSAFRQALAMEPNRLSSLNGLKQSKDREAR